MQSGLKSSSYSDSLRELALVKDENSGWNSVRYAFNTTTIGR